MTIGFDRIGSAESFLAPVRTAPGATGLAGFGVPRSAFIVFGARWRARSAISVGDDTEKGPELVGVSVGALPDVPDRTQRKEKGMMQQVRRRIANLLPAAPEVSIPISAALQTGVASVTMLTLRFGSALTLGAVASAAVRPDSFPVQLLVSVLVAAVADRSGLIYLRIRRAG